MRADPVISLFAGSVQLHVEARFRQRVVRHRLQSVGQHVVTIKHAEHARHGERGRFVDCLDQRMGMRRANNGRIGLAIEAKVVGELALSSDQAQVFLATDGFAD